LGLEDNDQSLEALASKVQLLSGSLLPASKSLLSLGPADLPQRTCLLNLHGSGWGNSGYVGGVAFSEGWVFMEKVLLVEFITIVTLNHVELPLSTLLASSPLAHIFFGILHVHMKKPRL
jgi:hypothetical protein